MKFPGWLFVEYNGRSVNRYVWWSMRYECAARGEAPGAANPTAVWKLAPVVHKQESICGQMNEWGCGEEDGCEAILFYILNELWKLPETRVDWIAQPHLLLLLHYIISRAGSPASQVCSIRPSGFHPREFPGQLLKRNSISDPQQMGVKD